MLTEDFQALNSHFSSNWSGVFTVYENQPNVTTPTNAPWCRFGVTFGGSRHYAGSAQDGEKLQLGRVWLQVFVPPQTGLGTATTIIESFAALFRNVRLDGGAIHLRSEDIGPAVADPKGMVMIKVTVPFESYRRYS